jgi:hypothetical protein
MGYEGLTKVTVAVLTDLDCDMQRSKRLRTKPAIRRGRHKPLVFSFLVVRVKSEHFRFVAAEW